MLRSSTVLGASTALVTVYTVVIGSVLHAGSCPASKLNVAEDCPCDTTTVRLLENKRPLHSLKTSRSRVTVMFWGAGVTINVELTTWTL